MKKARFAKERIAFALGQVELGANVVEVCRKIGISVQAFHRWKRSTSGLAPFS